MNNIEKLERKFNPAFDYKTLICELEDKLKAYRNVDKRNKEEIADLKDKLHRRNKTTDNLRREIWELKKKSLLPEIQEITASDLQVVYQYLAEWQEQMRNVVHQNLHSNTKAETFIMKLIDSLLSKVDALQWSTKRII